MAITPWCTVQTCPNTPGCRLSWSNSTDLRTPLPHPETVHVTTCFDAPVEGSIARLPRPGWDKAEQYRSSPDLSEGTHWITTEIGPFTSTGGYDWWDMRWNDAGKLSLWLQRHGVLPISQFMESAVDSNRRALELPPLHLHHSHTTPGNDRAADALSWFFRGSGDQLCSDATGGGIACQGEVLDPYVKRLDQPLSAWAVFNDVRPRGSQPLTWWYQLSLLVKVGDQSTPTVSQVRTGLLELALAPSWV